jgi:alkylated DNA repair dioxygenase AlkB
MDSQPDHRLLSGWRATSVTGPLYRELVATAPWRDDVITLFGRTYPVPRRTAWFGDPGAVYAYSRIVHDPTPWTPTLATLREAVAAEAGGPFNSVLVNWYRDGQDSNGWHADDEPELGPEPLIASLSLGATRVMQFRHRETARRFDVTLHDGDLLVMWGDAQSAWVHAIAKSRRVQAGRINLTFRWVHPHRG